MYWVYLQLGNIYLGAYFNRSRRFLLVAEIKSMIMFFSI